MKNLKLLTLTVLLVSSCCQLFAQNLVLNPSFETITGCPIGPGEFLRATNWNDVNSGADSCSSPDLIAGCAPGIGGVNSPSMLIGYQASRTGSNHAGIILYEGVALTGCTPFFSDNYREYMEGQFSAPLVAGQTYCVSFYISLANQAKWGVNSIGVYFSNGLYQHNFCTAGSPAPVTPQLQYTGSALVDTTNWVRLQWTYTATGGETHFVIGNFRNDAGTPRTDNNCGSIHSYAYYFIDDVSVVPGICTVTCPTINATAVVSNVSCGSTNNGAINLTPSGGQTPYTYLWSNGSVSEDIGTLVAGPYSVTMTDANSCTGTFAATVTSSPGLSINPNPTSISCNGLINGVAAVNVSGGSGSYTYTWSNGATTASISGLAAGNYPVTVSSGSSGPTVDTMYQQNFSGTHGWTLNVASGINSATPQTWTVNAQEGGVFPPGCGVANNGNNTLHVTCTSLFCGTFITGAVYNATEQTNRRAESPSFSTVGYTGITLNFNYISLGDALLDNASVLYNDGGGWQVLNPSIKSPVCGSGQGQWTAFSATLPASCNNNPNVRIGINWTNNNDNIGTDPSIALDNIVITSPGTGGSACSGTQTVTITAPSAVSSSAVAVPASCGQNNGSVDLTVSGGTGAFSYIWNNAATAQDINGLASGLYSVTVSDANNCTGTATANVTATGSISINTSTVSSSCASSNGSINLTVNTGTAPFTYSWSNGATSQDISGLSAGIYTVTVNDAAFCSTISSVNVSSNSSSTVTVDSVQNVSCNGGNNGAAFITAVSPQITCSSPTVVINEVMYRPDTMDGNSANPLLTGEYIELIGPPGANIGCFVLSDGDWAITIPPGTVIPADGIYTLGHNASPYAITNAIVYDLDVANCACFTAGTTGNGILIFTNGGEYVGLYNNTGTFIDGLLYGLPTAGNTPPSGAITTAGVINTSGLSGCPATINIATTGYLTHPAGVTANISLVRIPDGSGGAWSTQVGGSPNACNANATPTLTYQWSNGATTEDVSGLTAGVYIVTVTDALGCPTIRTVTVTEPSAITATLNSVAALCVGSANGSATVSANGGIAPYSFIWNNASTTATINGLSAGSYTVTVNDANSCSLVRTITITQPSAITVNAAINNIACSSSNIGGINLTVNGGTAGYSFNWSNAATSQNISGLAAGSYTVTVNDANSCSTTFSGTVQTTAGLQVDASGTDLNCNGSNDGCASVVVNGGSAPYTYIWSNGQTIDGFCGLAAGTYIVTVSDNGGGGSGFDTLYQEGFEAAHNWTLNVSTGVNGVDNNFWTVSDAEGGVLPTGCGVGGNGNKTLHITSVFLPTGGAAYDAGGFCGVLFCPETNMRAESPVFSTVGANNLSLSFDFISNGQALLDNASVWYNSGTGWTQLVNSIKSPVCGNGQGEWTNFAVPLPASCNNNPNVQVAFNWTNNDDGVGTDPSVAVNNVLVYNSGPVTVSCSGTDTVVIAQPAVLASNTVNITDANCSSPGAINIAVSGGTAPYSFLWSNGVTSEDITGLNAGSYSVSITDANGCNVVNAANTVNASGLPAITVSSSVDPTCNGYNDGSISLNVSGGSAPYSFNWNAGLNGQNLSGLDGGIYNVTVTDALGCTSTLSSITLTEPAAIVLSSIVLTDANCENSDGSINYTVSGGAGTPFSFNWSNSATTQNLTGLSSGTYNLTVTDANGCNQPDTFTINAPFVPTLAAFIGQTGVSDSTIILGESISVNVGNDETALGVSYQWVSVPSTANFANDSAAATLVAPDPFGNYILNVIASSAGGCTAVDTLTLTVQSPDNPRIPTAFSPNGDNNNDNFFVIDLNLEYLKEFKIFNRWGQVVYDNTTQAKWDGKLNGADQPRDVYLYIITWQRPNDVEPVVNRGSLTLFR